MPPSSAPASSASAALDDGDARKPEDFIKVMGGKQPSKFTDPCAKAAKQSMKCLDDNNYDRTKCGPFFNQYWAEPKRRRFTFPALFSSSICLALNRHLSKLTHNRYLQRRFPMSTPNSSSNPNPSQGRFEWSYSDVRTTSSSSSHPRKESHTHVHHHGSFDVPPHPSTAGGSGGEATNASWSSSSYHSSSTSSSFSSSSSSSSSTYVGPQSDQHQESTHSKDEQTRRVEASFSFNG